VALKDNVHKMYENKSMTRDLTRENKEISVAILAEVLKVDHRVAADALWMGLITLNINALNRFLQHQG
jgi:hypothetical protein